MLEASINKIERNSQIEILKLNNNIKLVDVCAIFNIVEISVEPVILIAQIENNSSALSLNLLNVNALNADFNEAVLVDQKFINKKDVKPISSQPKNSAIILFERTNSDILYINIFIYIINFIA